MSLQPSSMSPPGAPIASADTESSGALQQRRNAAAASAGGDGNPTPGGAPPPPQQQGWYGGPPPHGYQHHQPPPPHGGHASYGGQYGRPYDGYYEDESKTRKTEHDVFSSEGPILNGGCLHTAKLVTIACALAGILHVAGRSGARGAERFAPQDFAKTAKKDTGLRSATQGVLEDEDDGLSTKVQQQDSFMQQAEMASQNNAGMGQNGMMMQQPSMMAGQNGMMMQNGMMPQQGGMMTQPNMVMPQQNGMMMQPGMVMPQQTGMMMQPGMVMPQQNGMMMQSNMMGQTGMPAGQVVGTSTEVVSPSLSETVEVAAETAPAVETIPEEPAVAEMPDATIYASAEATEMATETVDAPAEAVETEAEVVDIMAEGATPVDEGNGEAPPAELAGLGLEELGNFKDAWDPWEPSDVPVFLHIPKAGGSTVKDVIGTCHRFVMASEFGITDGHADDEEIAVVYPGGGPTGQDRSPFVNVDTTTVDGIARAHEMGFADSGLADAVVTPFLYEANNLFTPTAKGRLFTVFRHPIDRAISMFYYIQVADWEPSYAPELKDWTIEQYAQSDKIENNWLTRQLVHKDSGDLNDDDLKLAMEVIRRKFLVGLMTEIEATMERFERFYRWTYHVNPPNQEKCRESLLGGGSNKNTKKKKVEEDSEAWRLLAHQNNFDMQLFEYIESLFVEQEQFVADIPEGFRNIDATCCKCGPPTYPPEGFTCPLAILN